MTLPVRLLWPEEAGSVPVVALVVREVAVWAGPGLEGNSPEAKEERKARVAP